MAGFRKIESRTKMTTRCTTHVFCFLALLVILSIFMTMILHGTLFDFRGSGDIREYERLGLSPDKKEAGRAYNEVPASAGYHEKSPEVKLKLLERKLRELAHTSKAQMQKIQDLRSFLENESSTIKHNDEGMLVRLEILKQDFELASNQTGENTEVLSRLSRQAHRMQLKQREDSMQGDFLRREISQLKMDTSLGQSSINFPTFLKDDHGGDLLNPLRHYNQTFCLPWKVNSDQWWTQHPDWFVSKESETEYCFSPIQEKMKRNMFHFLYDIQFRGDCTQVHTKRMWSNGWGADISNIVDGLRYAMETNQPFQISNHIWHYAVKKDGSHPACPKKTMSCYFLPLSRCQPNQDKMFRGAFYYEFQPRFKLLENRYYLEYITRPRQWLRKAVYDFSETIKLPTPCAVFHVRRGDVVLHDKWARRYFAIDEYVDATKNVTNITDTIFLITDDANAVLEARAKFPNFHWVVIDRPRFSGKEGGWENYFPSNDPKMEVVVLMSIFRKATQCGVLTHTRSNLADYIAALMMSARGRNFIRVDMNADDGASIYDIRNSESYNVSKADWR